MNGNTVRGFTIEGTTKYAHDLDAWLAASPPSWNVTVVYPRHRVLEFLFGRFRWFDRFRRRQEFHNLIAKSFTVEGNVMSVEWERK